MTLEEDISAAVIASMGEERAQLTSQATEMAEAFVAQLNKLLEARGEPAISEREGLIIGGIFGSLVPFAVMVASATGLAAAIAPSVSDDEAAEFLERARKRKEPTS